MSLVDFKKQQMSHVTIIFSPLVMRDKHYSLSFVTKATKGPCRPVDFGGLRPF